MDRFKLAMLAVGALVIGTSLGTSPSQARDYVFEGNSYCFYADGWRGPGWYRCGYRLRRGLGWGGPRGWHGWGGGVEFRERRGVELRERSGTAGRGGVEIRERGGTAGRGGAEIRERSSTTGRGGGEIRGQGGASRSGGGNVNAPVRGGGDRENH
jgi:hypothetical protein